MPSKAEIEALRQEVRRRHKAATDKISRIRRTSGASVSGTEFDPRVSTRAIKRYNSRQLNAYLNRLNSFTSRNTQFISGAQGAPLSRAAWERVAKLQESVNAKTRAHVAKHANKPVIGSDMTVGEREEFIRNNSLRGALGEASKRPAQTFNFKPYHIKDMEGLKKIERTLRKRLSSDFIPKEISNQRKQMMDILEAIGYKKFIKQGRALTDEQFDLLWNYQPGFAADLGHIYDIMTRTESRSIDAAQIQENYDNVAYVFDNLDTIAPA